MSEDNDMLVTVREIVCGALNDAGYEGAYDLTQLETLAVYEACIRYQLAALQGKGAQP